MAKTAPWLVLGSHRLAPDGRSIMYPNARIRPLHPTFWLVLWRLLDIPLWLKPFGWCWVMARLVR